MSASRHILAVTIPCTRRSFLDRAHAGVRDGIVDMLLRTTYQQTYRDYGLEACADRYEPTLTQISAAVDAARASNFEIALEPTLAQAGEWFSTDEVVALVAHSHDTRIEFVDAMASLDDLLQVMAPEFHGVLDLIGCETAWTGDHVHFARDRVTVIHGKQPLRVDHGLFLFRATLEYMRRFGVPYQDAVMDLRLAWARKRMQKGTT